MPNLGVCILKWSNKWAVWNQQGSAPSQVQWEASWWQHFHRSSQELVWEWQRKSAFCTFQVQRSWAGQTGKHARFEKGTSHVHRCPALAPRHGHRMASWPEQPQKHHLYHHHLEPAVPASPKMICMPVPWEHSFALTHHSWPLPWGGCQEDANHLLLPDLPSLSWKLCIPKFL